jgi:hypothetical protein
MTTRRSWWLVALVIIFYFVDAKISHTLAKARSPGSPQTEERSG